SPGALGSIKSPVLSQSSASSSGASASSVASSVPSGRLMAPQEWSAPPKGGAKRVNDACGELTRFDLQRQCEGPGARGWFAGPIAASCRLLRADDPPF